MKIPVSWLKDYVDINLSPTELADKLVSAGFEIEEIIDERKQVTRTVVGKIVGIEKHPNADKLRICYVKVGSENVDIVTNSKTVNIGDLVPVALDGAHLANGMDIKKGEVREVLSEGMFCGPQELGLQKGEYPGAEIDEVLKLKETAVIGSDINDEIGKNDIILDIALTANRADCNSIIGIAREVAAVTGQKMRDVDISFVGLKRPNALKGVTVKNKELCPRYMAAEVTDVKIEESPEIIKKRLIKVGIRPINNVVDITNYVLIEVGQPMHAFDFEKLRGREIVVRNASVGEEIVALDGNNYKVSPKNLVICDGEGIVALAGVMGGENSSISDETGHIIFESARFARDSVRLTSRALNLRSDSSTRFEKGVDFYCQNIGLRRALNLMEKYGYGTVTDDIIDTNPNLSSKIIRTNIENINAILGIDVPKNAIKEILNSLNIETAISDNGDIIAVIPLYREDVDGTNDLAEEVIRIYGYDKLIPTLIKHAETVKGGRNKEQNALLKMKEILIGEGMHEIVTYSFVSPKMFDILRLKNDNTLRNVIKIENPIGEDFSIMRTTLVYSMMKTLSLNYQRGNKSGRYFESAKRYFPVAQSDLKSEEKQTISLGVIGDAEDFYSTKEIVEILLERIGLVAQFEEVEIEYMHPTRTASIIVDGQTVGYVGEVHPLVAKAFDVDKKMFVAELDADLLISVADKMPVFKSIPKFQSVTRDLALLVDENVSASSIIDSIWKSDMGIIEDVNIFDVYKGGQVEAGKKSIAVNIVLRDAGTTLVDAVVNGQIADVLKGLENSVGAKLRT